MWALLLFVIFLMVVFGLIAMNTFQRFAYAMEDLSTVANIANRNI